MCSYPFITVLEITRMHNDVFPASARPSTVIRNTLDCGLVFFFLPMIWIRSRLSMLNDAMAMMCDAIARILYLKLHSPHYNYISDFRFLSISLHSAHVHVLMHHFIHYMKLQTLSHRTLFYLFQPPHSPPPHFQRGYTHIQKTLEQWGLQ